MSGEEGSEPDAAAATGVQACEEEEGGGEAKRVKRAPAQPSRPQTAGGAAGSSTLADDLTADLYSNLDNLDVPQRPSDFTLRRSLAAAKGEREALEAEVLTLREAVGTAKERLQTSVRSACVILCTARRELRRKGDRLAALQKQGGRKPHSSTAPGLGCVGAGPVVEGRGSRRASSSGDV